MVTSKKKTLYGFEDYTVYTFNINLIDPNNSISRYDFHPYFYNNWTMFICGDDIPRVKAGWNYEYVDWDKMVQYNEAVLNTAKKLYIYPECKIPRSHVAKKYKKVLNPWMADAVVLPTQFTEGTFYQGLFFINEKKKAIYTLYNTKVDAPSQEQGAPFPTFITQVQYNQISALGESNLGILESEFLGYYSFIKLENANPAVELDILNGTIPSGKLVRESDVIKSLSDKDNEITYENLVSIRDMLNSSDPYTKGSAIKALAAMDYMSCPQSVKRILYEASNWQYNPATDTTAAKYMFKTLLGGTARNHIYFQEDTISEKDYEIFQRLVKDYYRNNESGAIMYLRNLSFTYKDANYNVYPRLKKAS